VSKQVENWSASLMLVPPPGPAESLYVDLTSSQGLRRQERSPGSGRILFLDTSRIYAQIVERMRWLPEHDDETPKPDDLPPREERLLLMRLASLFGPESVARAPRAARYTAEGEVRVVMGLGPLTRAIAEIDRLPDAARTPGVAASYDEITEMISPNAGP